MNRSTTYPDSEESKCCLREIVAKRQAVWAQMEALVKDSKKANTIFNLDLYRREEIGYLSVHWLDIHGRPRSWAIIEDLLDHIPPKIAEKYRRFQEEALMLNAQEQIYYRASRLMVKWQNDLGCLPRKMGADE